MTPSAKQSATLSSHNKRGQQPHGPKVQRYTPDGSQCLRTYEGYQDACADTALPCPTPECIKKAANEKRLYKGFRWAQLPRELPDDTFQEIGTTVEAQTARIGQVAILDLAQERIVDVFPDMTGAARNRHFKGPAPISNAVKRATPSGGHYFRMWHECAEELKDAFLKDHDLPLKKRKGATGVVAQNEVTLAETFFGSIAEAQRSQRVGRKSLKDALESGDMLKGFTWRLTHTEDDD